MNIEQLTGRRVVAVLRGLTPDEAAPIGAALLDAGVDCAEVPLNSPEPLESIARMRRAFGSKMFVGAGTVLTEEDVARVAEAGGQFIVAPNVNARVIAAAKRRELAAIPGFMTPTEAFMALEAGADALKLFPADQVGPAFIKAIRAVLPAKTLIYAVGGVTEGEVAAYLAAGAYGVGLGSNLYKPGDTPDAVGRRAAAFVAAVKDAAQIERR